MLHQGTQKARKLKKVQAKKLVKSNKSIKKIFREITFLAVLNFFPIQKLNFWPFLKLQKKRIWSKKFFCQIDLFDFTVFLQGSTNLGFFGPGLS